MSPCSCFSGVFIHSLFRLGQFLKRIPKSQNDFNKAVWADLARFKLIEDEAWIDDVNKILDLFLQKLGEDIDLVSSMCSGFVPIRIEPPKCEDHPAKPLKYLLKGAKADKIICELCSQPGSKLALTEIFDEAVKIRRKA